MRLFKNELVWTAVLALALGASVSSVKAQTAPAPAKPSGQPKAASPAPAPEKPAPGEISLKTVKVLIGETITLIPSEITKSDGTVIKFDKSDLSKIIVPYEDAVRIIKIANMSAEANICDMPEVEAQNWDALRTHEVGKKVWSDQQLFFINRLHFLVVVTRTGKYQVAETAEKESANKPTASTDLSQTKKPVCSDAQKNDIRSKLEAYWVEQDKKKS